MLNFKNDASWTKYALLDVNGNVVDYGVKGPHGEIICGPERNQYYIAIVGENGEVTKTGEPDPEEEYPYRDVVKISASVAAMSSDVEHLAIVEAIKLQDEFYECHDELARSEFPYFRPENAMQARAITEKLEAFWSAASELTSLRRCLGAGLFETYQFASQHAESQSDSEKPSPPSP